MKSGNCHQRSKPWQVMGRGTERSGEADDRQPSPRLRDPNAIDKKSCGQIWPADGKKQEPLSGRTPNPTETGLSSLGLSRSKKKGDEISGTKEGKQKGREIVEAGKKCRRGIVPEVFLTPEKAPGGGKGSTESLRAIKEGMGEVRLGEMSGGQENWPRIRGKCFS